MNQIKRNYLNLPLLFFNETSSTESLYTVGLKMTIRLFAMPGAILLSFSSWMEKCFHLGITFKVIDCRFVPMFTIFTVFCKLNTYLEYSLKISEITVLILQDYFYGKGLAG